MAGRSESQRSTRRMPRPFRGRPDFGDGRSNKFGASKVTEDGIVFDSKRELSRYRELKLLEKAGVISHLECHPRWYFMHPVTGEALVIPSARYKNGRKVSYTADFRYLESQRLVVEDVKGMDTGESRLRRALMKWIHGIDVQVIR